MGAGGERHIYSSGGSIASTWHWDEGRGLSERAWQSDCCLLRQSCALHVALLLLPPPPLAPLLLLVSCSARCALVTTRPHTAGLQAAGAPPLTIEHSQAPPEVLADHISKALLTLAIVRKQLWTAPQDLSPQTSHAMLGARELSALCRILALRSGHPRRSNAWLANDTARY